jgi:two-component system CheB/CheR fusion protein
LSDADDAREGAGDGAVVTEPGFAQLIETLSASYEFDFREYREGSLARRIRARMSHVHVDTFEAYTQFLAHHPGEHVQLFNTILINVTGFFRDAPAWRLLAEDVIPAMVERARNTRSIRVWSAGCSSGEEPFSVAMLLAEHLGHRAHDFTVKIYGTDVDEDALSAARHACYRADQLRDVPDDLVSRYFTPEGQLYRFRRDLRRWGIFGSHNVTQEPPLSHMDLVLCRNVLIYFSSELQDRVLSRLHYALREGGTLFLGRSESLLARSRLFRPRHLKWRIFERAGGPETYTIPLSERVGARDVVAAPEPSRAESSASLAARRALEALPFAVMVVDMGDTVVGWNAAAASLFDVPIAHALAQKFRDLDVSYRVEGLRARIEDVKTRHDTVRMDEVSFTRRNGDVARADVTLVPLVEGERMVGVMGVAVDSTEQPRLREQIARIAEQHATAIEELQSTNEELETTNEELQSTNEELETTNEELQSTNEELETTVEELHAANTELGALNTELEARTAELNRLDRAHRTFLNSLDEAVIGVDRHGVVTTWNHVAERLWGLRAEHVVGRALSLLPIGSVAPRAGAAAERVISTGRPEHVPDATYALPGGEERRGAMRVFPLRNEAGEVTGAVGTLMPGDGARSD